MRSLIGLAAVGCAVSAVQARGPYKWSQDKEARNWHPARETPELGFMPALGMAQAPLPTPPPKVDEGKFRKRSSTENTCAYVSGESDLSLSCNTDSACVFNSGRSNIGCCPDTSISCAIWTTCYEFTESDKYTTNNGYSLWCGNSAFPHCVTHQYGTGDLFAGYTLLGCGKTKGSDIVFYSATAKGPSSTSKTSTTTPPVTVTAPPQQTTEAASSGAPVGAIVGGVVGGVAALGLIGLGAFFIIRRGKRSKDPGVYSGAAPPAHTQSPPPGAGGMYGGVSPPPMAEQPIHQAQYGFAPVDNRSSIAKAPYYDASVVSSAPTSPPLHSPAPMYQQYAAGGQQSQQPQNYAPGMGHHSGPVPASYQAAELDTNRGDRELRELE